MMDRNSLAGEMLKIKLVEIDILIEDKRVRHVESIATVLAYWFKNGQTRAQLSDGSGSCVVACSRQAGFQLFNGIEVIV